MSDARAPAMDVHMTPQDAGMARSFWLILSALLIGVNGYLHSRHIFEVYLSQALIFGQGQIGL